MKLDEILKNFDNKYEQVKNNRSFKSVGDFNRIREDIVQEAISQIRQWVLEQIPDESIDYDDNYRDGFNACRDLIITKFKESE